MISGWLNNAPPDHERRMYTRGPRSRRTAIPTPHFAPLSPSCLGLSPLDPPPPHPSQAQCWPSDSAAGPTLCPRWITSVSRPSNYTSAHQNKLDRFQIHVGPASDTLGRHRTNTGPHRHLGSDSCVG